MRGSWGHQPNGLVATRAPQMLKPTTPQKRLRNVVKTRQRTPRMWGGAAAVLVLWHTKQRQADAAAEREERAHQVRCNTRRQEEAAAGAEEEELGWRRCSTTLLRPQVARCRFRSTRRICP